MQIGADIGNIIFPESINESWTQQCGKLRDVKVTFQLGREQGKMCKWHVCALSVRVNSVWRECTLCPSLFLVPVGRPRFLSATAACPSRIKIITLEALKLTAQVITGASGLLRVPMKDFCFVGLCKSQGLVAYESNAMQLNSQIPNFQTV